VKGRIKAVGRARKRDSVVDEASSTLPQRGEEVQRASYAAAESWIVLGVGLEAARNSKACRRDCCSAGRGAGSRRRGCGVGV
jgi:hypothetical protein